MSDADLVIDIEVKKKKKSPKLVATAYTSRHSGFYVFNAFFLIFLITASSLSVFSINSNLSQNRLQVTYTILLASISFKWVINRSLPPVSYLTFLDKYSIFCILYINVLAAYHAIIAKFNAYFHQDTDVFMLIMFASSFLMLHVVCYICYFIISKKKRDLKRDERRCISYLADKKKITKQSLLSRNREDDDEDEYD